MLLREPWYLEKMRGRWVGELLRRHISRGEDRVKIDLRALR